MDKWNIVLLTVWLFLVSCAINYGRVVNIDDEVCLVSESGKICGELERVE